MNCPNCHGEVQPGWKACPACGEKLLQKKFCANCGKNMDASWKVCPFCGAGTQEPGLPSADIRDSVVKELHQNQHTDARSAGGASVAGGIHFTIGEKEGHRKTVRNAEVKYEESVLMVLQAGGTLEQDRTKLDEIGQRLGLTLRATAEIEAACLPIITPENSPELKITTKPELPKSSPAHEEPPKYEPEKFTIRGKLSKRITPLSFATEKSLNSQAEDKK